VPKTAARRLGDWDSVTLLNQTLGSPAIFDTPTKQEFGDMNSPGESSNSGGRVAWVLFPDIGPASIHLKAGTKTVNDIVDAIAHNLKFRCGKKPASRSGYTPLEK
jgi:hypothetical protein